MLARLCAFVVWALVAATAVFWGLRLIVRAPTAPDFAVAVADATVTRGDLTRLLGAAPVTPVTTAPAIEASSRFKLLGIMAPKGFQNVSDTPRGVALIAVDGKMPKAYRVGAHLDGDLVLQSVTMRSAAIGGSTGGARITLELPPLAAAATGVLAPFGAGAQPVPAGSPVAMPGGAPPGASSQFAPPGFVPPTQSIAPQASQPPNPAQRSDAGGPIQ